MCRPPSSATSASSRSASRLLWKKPTCSVNLPPGRPPCRLSAHLHRAPPARPVFAEPSIRVPTGHFSRTPGAASYLHQRRESFMSSRLLASVLLLLASVNWAAAQSCCPAAGCGTKPADLPQKIAVDCVEPQAGVHVGQIIVVGAEQTPQNIILRQL